MRGEATPDFAQSSLQDLIQNVTIKEPLNNNSQNVLRFTILADAEKRQIIRCLLSKSGTK